MTVKKAIRAKATEVYGEPSPNVYKGVDYDGAVQAYGWWYKPFNRQPVYLGTSRLEAIAILEQIDSGQEA